MGWCMGARGCLYLWVKVIIESVLVRIWKLFELLDVNRY